MKNIELLSEIALTFIRPASFDSQVNCALEIIGKKLNVSRVYIFTDNETGSITSNTYEWCNTGIKPQIDELQNLEYSRTPSWRMLLIQEGRIFSEDINTLPDDIKKFLRHLDILSIIIYPLIINQQILGFIGFDECLNKRKWSDIELELLRAISAIISTSMERNQLQMRVISSENNFRNFFNTINDLFIIGNPAGDIIYTNRSVEKKLGYSIDELKLMNILDLHPEEKRDPAADVIIKMLRGDREFSPLEIRTKDGRSIPVETRLWRGKWDNNDCIFGIYKDLRKEQEALQKFTKIFESNPSLMTIINIEDRVITDVNSAFLKKLGYSKSEVIGKTSVDLGLFADPIQREIIIENLRSTGKVRDIELVLRCKDGSIINGLFSGETIDNIGNRSYLTVMTDLTEQVALRVKVEEQRKRLENIIEGTHLGTWEWNIKTGETVFNERWAQIIGYTLEELEPVNIATWLKFCHPDDLIKSDEQLVRHFNHETDYYESESRMKHKNGGWVWVLDRGKVIEWDNDGSPVRMFGTHSNITMQKMAEIELRESHAELERFFSVNLDLLCIADTNGNFIKTNRAWEDILGYSTEELESRKFLEFIHPDDIDATLKTMSDLNQQKQVLNFTNRCRSRDGSYRSIEWRSHPYGKFFYAAARDITDRINYEERIKELSIRDPLTNIYNRRYIFERLEGIISEFSRGGSPFSISILDIDLFKKINDIYGHLAGDYILKEFSGVVNKNLRTYDLFGRYGGEEFIVVSMNSVRKQTKTTIERILSVVREKTFLFNNNEITFTFSAGISDSREYKIEKLSSETIIETADNRLYMAKKSGRNMILTESGQ